MHSLEFKWQVLSYIFEDPDKPRSSYAAEKKLEPNGIFTSMMYMDLRLGMHGSLETCWDQNKQSH